MKRTKPTKEKQFRETGKLFFKFGVLAAKERIIKEFLGKKNWEKVIKELDKMGK